MKNKTKSSPYKASESKSELHKQHPALQANLLSPLEISVEMKMDPSGLPLSPTHLISGVRSIQVGIEDQIKKFKQDHISNKNTPTKQFANSYFQNDIDESNQIMGTPKFAGLSTLDFCLDELYFQGLKIQKPDKQICTQSLQRYIRLLYGNQFPQQNINYFLQMHIALPYQMMIEQIEIKFNNQFMQFFEKYIKIACISRYSLENQGNINDVKLTKLSVFGQKADQENEAKRLRTSSIFKLEKGFIDNQQAELNFKGAVANQLYFVFEVDINQLNQLFNDCKNILQTLQSENGISLIKNNDQKIKQTTDHQQKDQNLVQNILVNLDQEVSNIQKKSKLKNYKIPDDNSNSFLRPDDIKIVIEDSTEIQDSQFYKIDQFSDSLQKNKASIVVSQEKDSLKSSNSVISGINLKEQLEQNQRRFMIYQQNQFPSKLNPNQNTPNQKFIQEQNNLSEDERRLLEELQFFISDQTVLLQDKDPFSQINWNNVAEDVLKRGISSVRIIGFNMMKIPAITTLSHLMNTSFLLKKEQIHLEDSIEIDLFLGTLLISSKRNTQAIEVLRNKVQKYYLQQIKENMADGQINIATRKLFIRSAMIELMCAEAMNTKQQIPEKLQAINRLCQLCQGNLIEVLSFGRQIYLGDDEYTTIVKVLPWLLKFCLGCIDSRPNCNYEIIQISALRTIQFILETQGCSLDQAMVIILKQIFKNYPDANRNSRWQKYQIELKARLRRIKLRQQKKDQTNQFGFKNQNQIIFSSYGTVSQENINQVKNIDSLQNLIPVQTNLRYNYLNEGKFVVQPGSNSTAELPQGNHRLDISDVYLSHDISSARNYKNQQNEINQHNLQDQQKENITSQIHQILHQQIDKSSIVQSAFTPQNLLNTPRDEPSQRKEPNSGFEKIQISLFNAVLDTYISVLSSISSHILHEIFYEVIVPCLIGQPFKEDILKLQILDKTDKALAFGEFSNELKIYAVKIAEKIITICQGDLIINGQVLDLLVKVSAKQQMDGQAAEQYRNLVKNLWNNIRAKVFTNYSMRGLKQLVEWLVQKMSILAQNCTIVDGKSSASEIAMLELSDDDLQQLCQYLEIITYISVGRRSSQGEEINSLIKIRYEFCMDLYLLLNPLLFWLDFSVEREERLTLFKSVYKTIKDVLDNLPPKKVDIDILQIIMPILQRTSEYLRHSSPTQSMLKFLDIVLQDILAIKLNPIYSDLQYFFLDMLASFSGYIAFSLYEEIFPVFDKLLQLCQDVITDSVLRRCVAALVDKCTIRGKQQKHSIQQFLKSLLDNNSFQVKSQQPNDATGKNIIQIVSQQDKIQQNAKSKQTTQRTHEQFEENIQEISLQNYGENSLTDNSKNFKNSDQNIPQKHQKAKKNSFFEVMLDYCFFDNNDKPAQTVAQILQYEYKQNKQEDEAKVRALFHEDRIVREDEFQQFRSPNDLHEISQEKLQFFIDALQILSEKHITQFSNLVGNKKFKQSLYRLLEFGETSIRLKCHEILEIVATYYVQNCTTKTVYEVAIPEMKDKNNLERFPENFGIMEVDVISPDRLLICQIIIQCILKSYQAIKPTQINKKGNKQEFAEQNIDSYLQFNSLILLDYLFQNLLPVASFPNEKIKEQEKEGSILVAVEGFFNSKRIEQENRLDSELEDGSSGGENGRRSIRRFSENQGSNYINSFQNMRSQEESNKYCRIMRERVLNPYYLGEIDEAYDLFSLKIDEKTNELEVTDPKYQALRLKLVFKIWPLIQQALNSPWSNIRSICYGLVCSMLKIDIYDCLKYLPHPQINLIDDRKMNTDNKKNKLNRYSKHFGNIASILELRNNQLTLSEHEILSEIKQRDENRLQQNSFYKELSQTVIPMMINLLGSKESESKAGGLNILGSICGLSYDFQKERITQNLDFFDRNAEFITLPIWQLVFELQDDWDITIKEASIVLIQLCAPRDAIFYFHRLKVEKESIKFAQMLNKMAKSGAQGGNGSRSNLSSARQNSFYNQINSKNSMNNLKKILHKDGNGQGDSSARIDYTNVDFGYKNQNIALISNNQSKDENIIQAKAEIRNDQQKFINMEKFLSDQYDLLSLDSQMFHNQKDLNNQKIQNKQTGDEKVKHLIDDNDSLSGGIAQFENLISGRNLGNSLAELGFSQADAFIKYSDEEWKTAERAYIQEQDENELTDYQISIKREAKQLNTKRIAPLNLDRLQEKQQTNSVGSILSKTPKEISLQENKKILQNNLQKNQRLIQAIKEQNNKTEEPDARKQFEFFVDNYKDEQVQEIISIFRNDFKPPKNLWIEKPSESALFTSPDFYQEIFVQAIEQFNQQQLVLQQKQQQELQDQVSGGLNTDNNIATNDEFNNEAQINQQNFQQIESSQSNESIEQNLFQKSNENIKIQEKQENNQIKFSPPIKYEQDLKNLEESQINKQQNEQEKLQQNANVTFKNIIQNLKINDQKEDEQKQDSDKKHELQKEQKQELNEESNKDERAIELNQFLEHINFDDMNINMEDINQVDEEIINQFDEQKRLENEDKRTLKIKLQSSASGSNIEKKLKLKENSQQKIEQNVPYKLPKVSISTNSTPEFNGNTFLQAASKSSRGPKVIKQGIEGPQLRKQLTEGHQNNLKEDQQSNTRNFSNIEQIESSEKKSSTNIQKHNEQQLDQPLKSQRGNSKPTIKKLRQNGSFQLENKTSRKNDEKQENLESETTIKNNQPLQNIHLEEDIKNENNLANEVIKVNNQNTKSKKQQKPVSLYKNLADSKGIPYNQSNKSSKDLSYNQQINQLSLQYKTDRHQSFGANSVDRSGNQVKNRHVQYQNSQVQQNEKKQTMSNSPKRSSYNNEIKRLLSQTIKSSITNQTNLQKNQKILENQVIYDHQKTEKSSSPQFQQKSNSKEKINNRMLLGISQDTNIQKELNFSIQAQGKNSKSTPKSISNSTGIRKQQILSPQKFNRPSQLTNRETLGLSSLSLSEYPQVELYNNTQILSGAASPKDLTALKQINEVNQKKKVQISQDGIPIKLSKYNNKISQKFVTPHSNILSKKKQVFLDDEPHRSQGIGSASPALVNKSSTLCRLDAQQTQMIIDHMKNQTQLNISMAETAKNIKKSLKKNGFNINQLNAILSQSQSGVLGSTQSIIKTSARIESGGTTKAYQSVRQSRGKRCNKQASTSCAKGFYAGNKERLGSSGLQKTLLSAQFDLTPSSGENQGGSGSLGRIQNLQQRRSETRIKTQKSNKSLQNRLFLNKSSYSPPSVRDNHLGNIENYNFAFNNKQVQSIGNMVMLSQRDAISAESRGRSCSTNKSGKDGALSSSATADGWKGGIKAAKKKHLKQNEDNSPNRNIQIQPKFAKLLLQGGYQTQKLDLHDLNRQLALINDKKGMAGSTQNKMIHGVDSDFIFSKSLLPQTTINQKVNQNLQFNEKNRFKMLELQTIRDKRDRSTSSIKGASAKNKNQVQPKLSGGLSGIIQNTNSTSTRNKDSVKQRGISAGGLFQMKPPSKSTGSKYKNLLQSNKNYAALSPTAPDSKF